MVEPECQGTHHFYIAEVVGVEAEGKVFVLLVCTACGGVICKDFTVSKGIGPLRLLREEKHGT